MEKTKLVRTFGTALATATLSFGLFAPVALAEKYDITTGAVVIVEDGKKEGAEKGDLIRIEIPATVADMAAIESGKMTFKASDGTFDQEFVVDLQANATKKELKWADVDDNKFAFSYKEDKNGQKVIDKILAKVRVGKNFMNGTWKLDDIKLYDVTNPTDDDDPIATITAEASFVVKGNDDVKPMAVDLESLIVQKTVARNKTNVLFGYTKLNLYQGDTITAIYENPAGVEQKYEDAVINGATFYFPGLNTQVDGFYNLKELTIKRQDGKVKTSVTYTGDELEAGDYTVGKTGVEAMLRLYNPYTGEHIYTNDPVEAGVASAAGWIYEGLAWYAPVDGLYRDAVFPVYRVYNQYNGEHHYTTSSVEALALVAAGWTDEGIGFYTTTKGDANAQAVYRLFNPFATVGTHHYTTGADERDAMVNAGWKDEGVGWYGVKVADLD